MSFRFSLPKASQVFAGAMASLRRFPLPLACAMLWVLVLILANHRWYRFGGGDVVGQIEIYLLLGFFWGLAATLYGEARGWAWRAKLALALPGYLFLILPVFLYGGNWDRWVDPTVFFLVPALVLLAMAAPFLAGLRGPDRHEGSPNLAFWDFNRASWLSAAFGYLVAMVAASGLMLVFFALDELFGLSIPSRVTEDIWILAFGLLCPWQALAGLPRRFAAPEDDQPAKWIAFLASYLLVPLTAVYLLILYAYIVKIAIAWELPKGQVGYLVSGFAIAGVVTHLFSHPLAAAGRPWVRAFQRHFYHALWAPLLLLWLAVATRIADYGVTESRYLIALFALWLTLLCGYFTLRGRRLILVPLSLSLLLVLATFGPWGAVDLSTRSQLSQFTGLLDRYGLMRNGKVLPAGKDLPFEDQKRISSIVGYFDERGRQDLLQPLLADLQFDQTDRTWRQAVMAAMVLSFVEEWQTEHSFNYNLDHGEVLELGGHDLFIRLGYFGQSARDYEAPGQGTYRATLSSDGKTLTVTGPKDRRLEFDLAGLAERLRADARPLERGDPEAMARMTLEARSGGLSGRLLVESINGKRKDETLEVQSGSGSLLISSD